MTAALPRLLVWLGLCLGLAGCRDATSPSAPDIEPDASPADTEGDLSAQDSAPLGDTTADSTADDTHNDTSDDTSTPADTARPADTDDLDAPQGTDDTDDLDAPADITDAGPEVEVFTCEPEAPCTLFGYVPPCYEGRCNTRDTCLPRRIPNCCLTDAECQPTPELAPCQTTRCVARTCTTLAFPGCCDGPAGCDDGLSATTDRCLPDSARCSQCAPACPERPPLLTATFDSLTALSAQGFLVLDAQPGDPVTWRPSNARSAAGGGALHLGQANCRTYYGGALDEGCLPRSASQLDSQRVQVTLATPVLALPADTPSSARVLVFAAVEPPLGRGDAEPDVLRVLVEPFGPTPSPTWPVASTLELGKSTDGWEPLAIDLAPWRGQTVRLRFEFDTLDGQDNLHEGVWLDELVVAPTCLTGCCESDLDCAPAAGCERATCLPFAQGSGRVCAALPARPGEPCTGCATGAECDDADPCTLDRCALPRAGALGACEHEVFCCLERDLLAADFGGGSLLPLRGSVDPSTGVGWQVRAGAAWFGHADTGTYAPPGPPARASGTLSSPPLTLPSGTLRLELSLTLTTEWDLQPPLATFDNPAGLDRLTVAVLDAGLRSVLWTSDEIGGTTRGEPLPLALDLSPYAGRTIELQLTFDSGDESANAFAGASIDDLAVGLRCRRPPGVRP